MPKAVINKRDKIKWDNAFNPEMEEGTITDTVSQHIEEIIEDHKDEIKAILGVQ